MKYWLRRAKWYLTGHNPSLAEVCEDPLYSEMLKSVAKTAGKLDDRNRRVTI